MNQLRIQYADIICDWLCCCLHSNPAEVYSHDLGHGLCRYYSDVIQRIVYILWFIYYFMKQYLEQRINQDYPQQFPCHEVGHKSLGSTSLRSTSRVPTALCCYHSHIQNFYCHHSPPILYLSLPALVNKPLFVWIIYPVRWGSEYNDSAVIVSVWIRDGYCLYNIDWLCRLSGS